MQVIRKKVSNLVGLRVGRLTVVGYIGKGKHEKHYWKCLCECGNYTELATYKITGKIPTQSCGCIRSEKLRVNRFKGFKHGLHKTKLYAIYHGMLQRCYNPSNQRYSYYGAKGVGVCQEWKNSIENFYNWAILNGYLDGLSIDRINTDGDYEPANCQWITVSENSRKMNNDRRRKI